MNLSAVIKGSRALFQRPDSTEPLSYEIPPASALRGILEKVYWHPGLYFDVREIQVLAPIRWDREGVTETRASRQTTDPSGAMLPRLDLRKGTFEAPIQLIRMTTRVVLRDPAWVVKFRFCQKPGRHPGAPSLAKAGAIFNRRLNAGQFFDVPALGIEEYPAIVSPTTGKEVPLQKSRDFGYVLHDIDYSESPPVQHVFRARMVNGVVSVPSFFDRVVSRRKAA